MNTDFKVFLKSFILAMKPGRETIHSEAEAEALSGKLKDIKSFFPLSMQLEK